MKITKKPLVLTHRKLILLLKKLNPCNRRTLLSQLNKEHIQCLSEICSNFLKKHLTINPQIINKLRRYKVEIRNIARKKTSLKKKKSILTSKRGGNILSIILPLASSLISKLLK